MAMNINTLNLCYITKYITSRRDTPLAVLLCIVFAKLFLYVYFQFFKFETCNTALFKSIFFLYVKEGDSLQTALVKSSKAVIGQYPEYDDLAMPVFNYAVTDKVKDMLKDGVLSLENTKSSTQRMMEILQMMVIFILESMFLYSGRFCLYLKGYVPEILDFSINSQMFQQRDHTGHTEGLQFEWERQNSPFRSTCFPHLTF